jgi:hypothetical protein
MLYKVSELAQALGVPDRTLRAWLVAGVPHVRDHRNSVWIHGREFADWVVNRRQQRKKHKLRKGEAFCLRCHQPVTMTAVSRVAQQGKLVLISGKCPVCGSRICRGDRLPIYPADPPAHLERGDET